MGGTERERERESTRLRRAQIPTQCLRYQRGREGGVRWEGERSRERDREEGRDGGERGMEGRERESVGHGPVQIPI